jgi:hypothetical protein
MIIEANPLPESIDFYISTDYVEADSLNYMSLLQTTSQV